MFRLIILPHMVRFANTRVAGNCPENYIEKYLVMSHLLMLKMPHSLKKKNIQWFDATFDTKCCQPSCL